MEGAKIFNIKQGGLDPPQLKGYLLLGTKPLQATTTTDFHQLIYLHTQNEISALNFNFSS